MRNRFHEQPLIVAFIEASTDPEVKEFKPYTKFISKWSDEQFWGVFDLCVEKVIKAQRSPAAFAAKPFRVKASFNYDKTYTPVMLKRAAQFRNQIK